MSTGTSKGLSKGLIAPSPASKQRGAGSQGGASFAGQGGSPRREERSLIGALHCASTRACKAELQAHPIKASCADNPNPNPNPNPHPHPHPHPHAPPHAHPDPIKASWADAADGLLEQYREAINTNLPYRQARARPSCHGHTYYDY